MQRTSLIGLLSVALLAASVTACGSAPPGARRAEKLLQRGDYEAAERTADDELSRFPKHPTLWRIKIQAAMGRGDNAQATKAYATWRNLRGADDRSMLRTMAKTTLWQALRTPSARINAKSIRIIERLEIEALAKEVAEKILDDNDLVAAAASVALLRSNPAAPRVATDLLVSDDPEARAIVVEGIGRKIGERARADLLPALADPDARVRRAAVIAIGAMKSDADTARLQAIAAGDPEGTVRAAALHALAEGERKDVSQAAERALTDSYLGARLAAVSLLARGGKAAVPELERLASSDDLFVALRAAVALHKAGGPSRLAPVERALAAEPWGVRVAAIAALLELADGRTARERLVPLLRDERAEVRIAAARALLGFGPDEHAAGVLVAELGSDNESVRLSAAIELARLRDARGVQALAQLIRSAEPSTRSAAVRAHLQAQRITPELVAALADVSGEVRLDAAETLLQLTK